MTNSRKLSSDVESDDSFADQEQNPRPGLFVRAAGLVAVFIVGAGMGLVHGLRNYRNVNDESSMSKYAHASSNTAISNEGITFSSRESLLEAIDAYLLYIYQQQERFDSNDEDSYDPISGAMVEPPDLPIGLWDVSRVEDLSEAFSAYRNPIIYNMEDPSSFGDAFDLREWDISRVTSLKDIFRSATRWNINVSTWNTASVQDMSNVFLNAHSFNPDLSAWKTNQVTTMKAMFYGASSFDSPMIHLTWNTSSCTDMSSMFYGAESFDPTLNEPFEWDTSQVVDMNQMFESATRFNGDLSAERWDTKRVTNMNGMFRGAASFRGESNSMMAHWNVGTVTDMSNMFRDAVVFNGKISTWVTSEVRDMSHLFHGAHEFRPDVDGLGRWNTSSVERMFFTFAECQVSDEAGLSSWDTSKVHEFSGMFYSATNFAGLDNIGRWNTSAAERMSFMFSSAVQFRGGLLDTWDTSRVHDMTGMFQNATNFNNPSISTWDVSSVQLASYILNECPLFNQDLSSWRLSSASDLSYMFYEATSFNQNLCSWQNSLNSSIFRNSVHDPTSGMFQLTSCDITTSPVTKNGPFCFSCA